MAHRKKETRTARKFAELVKELPPESRARIRKGLARAIAEMPTRKPARPVI